MIKEIKNLDVVWNSIIDIYNSVGWSVYTEEPEKLKRALNNSSYLYGEFEDEKLIGIIRGMTDQVSINYIQDILVLQNQHNKGIGTKIVQFVLDELKDVRTHVLLTDDDESQLAFYKKLKFSNTRELVEFPMNSFVRFKDLDLK